MGHRRRGLYPKSVRHVSFQGIYLSLALIDLQCLVLIGFPVSCCPVTWHKMVRFYSSRKNRKREPSRPDGPGSYDLIRAEGFPLMSRWEGGGEGPSFIKRTGLGLLILFSPWNPQAKACLFIVHLRRTAYNGITDAKRARPPVTPVHTY